MTVRGFSLPKGWYPEDSDEISCFLSDFTSPPGRVRAVVSPHAGWFYSGRIAAGALACLERRAETVVVLGGHLPSSMPPLFALEDAARTPLGNMPIDAELRAALQGKLRWREDRYADNTIEVLLPMLRFFFPGAMLLWLRLPAEIASLKTGRLLAEAAAKLNRRINVVASTDLTHYGESYGFAPRGSGAEALRWVREVNDARFIQAVEQGGGEETLKRAEREKSSCSAGAVLGAMGFAETAGLGAARLLAYGVSADIAGEAAPDSFVGYAALAFGP
jgi:AmmeMemoRadiSam system protein B